MKQLILFTTILAFVSCGKKVKHYHNVNELPETNTCYIANQSIVCGNDTLEIPKLDAELVTVCLDNPNTVSYPEVLLKLGNEYMAFLRDNASNNHRLVKLPENTLFQTTDGRDVLFSIVNGEINCI